MSKNIATEIDTCSKLNIFTDGAYFKNHSIGGWGYVFYCNQHELLRDSGMKKMTGSLEMELMAALQAIRSLAKLAKQRLPTQPQNYSSTLKITLHTDSRIILEGLFDKFTIWERNHWKVKSGKTVAYKTLWQELHDLTQQYSINWKWVKSHSGLKGNELADQLARKAALNPFQ